MSGAELCKGCGAVAVIWDTYDSQTTANSQKVCTECGAIAEEGSYAQEANLEGEYISSSYQHHSRNLPATYNKHLVSISEVHKESKKLLNTLCSKLKMTKPMINESKELYEKVYRNPAFLYKGRARKMLLVAGCIYIITRQHGWPISYHCLCAVSENEFTIHHIAKEVHAICNSFGIDLKSASLEEQVDGVLNQLGIDSDLKSLTQDIIQLFKEAWVAEGRNPRKIVLAAVFIAWQTSCTSTTNNDNLKQKFKTFTKFLESHNVTASPNLQARLREMLKMFCELACEIPWVNAKHVTTKTVYSYVNDILKYRNTLMINAYTQEDSESDANLEDDKTQTPGLSEHIDGKTDSCINSYSASNHTTDIALAKGQPAKKRTYNMLGERLPMSFKQPKLEDTTDSTNMVTQVPVIYHDLNNPELTEDDIPESSLQEYLRSPKEIEMRKRLDNCDT